ncbi:MAG: glycosyltransferase [Hyphomicrobium sp.]|nr:glycosyltransferase [Hyphomicrobium sp.]
MSNPTRILYLIGSLDVGGTERHLAMLVRSLNRARWQPAIYTLNRKGTLAPELEAAGVAIHSPLQLSWFARAGLLGRAARLVVVGVSLFAHLVRSRPPIVHCFLPASYLIGLPIALITRRPIRLMSRRSLNDYQRKGPLLARFERMLHGSVAAVLGNSRAVIRELEEEGIDKDRLRLIYNGIDVERTRPRIDRADTRARLGIALDVPVLINVANLIPYKGHLDLLEALGRARTKLPPPLAPNLRRPR